MKYRSTKKIKYLLLKAGQLKIIYSSKQDIFYIFSTKEGETAFFHKSGKLKIKKYNFAATFNCIIKESSVLL